MKKVATNTIDAGLLAKMFLAGAKNLEVKKEWINELNVFPVPDGDTGTNMTLTIMSAVKEVNSLTEVNMYNLSKAISSGSLRGARGNSGVILSQLLRGFTKKIRDYEELNAEILAEAMEKAVETAYKAVMKPKEGTILTVAKGAAEKAAELAPESEDLNAFIEDVLAHAEYVLSQTPEMLPVLKEAGVVDSGGQGLLTVLQGAYDAFLGKEIDLNFEMPEAKTEFVRPSKETEKEIKFGYCTEFIVNVTDFKKKPADLRKYLESIGDCVVVVDDEDIIKVHVHTDHPGQAIERGLTYGALCNMKIDNMRLQREKKAAAKKKLNEKPVPAKPEKRFGFVAVANGSGVESMFTDLGADCIVKGGQTMNPSADDILRAVYSVPAEIVFILPNNKNIIMAAEQAMKLSEKTMCVLRTTSVPQGMSAMMSFDPDSDFDTNRMNMSLAAEKVQSGLITFAARDSSFSGHEIKSGDILALENGRLSFIDRDVTRAAYKLTRKLVKNLKGSAGYVTVLYGSDVSDDKASELENIMKSKLSSLDINFVKGGQPVYYYIISVESE